MNKSSSLKKIKFPRVNHFFNLMLIFLKVVTEHFLIYRNFQIKFDITR